MTIFEPTPMEVISRLTEHIREWGFQSVSRDILWYDGQGRALPRAYGDPAQEQKGDQRGVALHGYLAELHSDGTAGSRSKQSKTEPVNTPASRIRIAVEFVPQDADNKQNKNGPTDSR